jgi:poly(3-hydroxybutyrate) depolymerase
MLLFVLSSCKALRTTSTPPKKQGNNKPDNDEVNGKSSGNNTVVFTGKLVKDITYATAMDYTGKNQQLTLDVYKPANAEGKKFPVVFLIHGGSFRGGNKNGLAETCSALANNGYVAIPINYRLGWGFISKQNANCDDSIFLKQAIYRAVQDAHSAMRYIAQHADEYNIDKNWFFLGGRSAGAITALITAYLEQKDADAFFPGLITAFGPMDKAAHTPGADYKLKGVISMWGAFPNPQLITKETALPTIFFQGQLDKAVPFKSGNFVPCSNASPVYGTYPLYNRLKELNVTAIAHVDPKGGHGVFEEDFRVKNILCFLNNVKQSTKKQLYLTGVQNSCDQ